MGDGQVRPQLSAIGLGTSATALKPKSDANATLYHAFKRGIRYFDTTISCGGGQAQIRLGQMLRFAPQDVIVSTKFGCTREFGAAPASQTGKLDKWAFSEAAIRESIERSSDRLHRDVLEIVFLHDMCEAQDHAFGEAPPVMRELHSQDQIGMIGVVYNTSAEHLAALNADGADALLVAGRWRLADRTTGSRLTRLVAEKDCKIIVGRALNSDCLCDHGDTQISLTLLSTSNPAQLAANLDGPATSNPDHLCKAVQRKALYA